MATPGLSWLARVLPWLLAAACLAGCAKPVPPIPAPQAPVADLVRIPQDPASFAAGPDAGRELLSPEAKAALADDFFQAYFKPWRNASKAPNRRDVAAPFRQFGAAPGYGRDNQPNSPGFIPSVEANAGLESYPNLGRPGVTVQPGDLRALPTSEPSYLDPTKPGEGYPFDYLQYSRIPQNTPVTVWHASRDGRWVYIEMAGLQGWMPREAVAFADQAFMDAFQTGTYAAFVSDGVRIDLGGGLGEMLGGVGTMFPTRSGGTTGLAAYRQGDWAALAPFAAPDGLAEAVPMPATPANIARVARALAGQDYGWGGIDNKRDCSLMLRDLFTPFGVWLPRNSATQAKAGRFVPLSGLSPAEKEQAILSQGVPFLTLIYLPGHIGLYIGAFEGRPVMFHNVWGVRTIRADGSDGRRVIGRAVVTTLSPGAELPDYDRDKSILGRVEGMTFLGR